MATMTSRGIRPITVIKQTDMDFKKKFIAWILRKSLFQNEFNRSRNVQTLELAKTAFNSILILFYSISLNLRNSRPFRKKVSFCVSFKTEHIFRIAAFGLGHLGYDFDIFLKYDNSERGP